MKKNKILFPKKVALLLGAAAVLLLGSTVGSTRAALTYYSENYSAQMNRRISDRERRCCQQQRLCFRQ